MANKSIKLLAADQGIGQDPPAATDAIIKEKANGQPSWCTVAQLIPAGGAAGQALTKVDGVDYNLVWATPAGGGGGGGGSGDMLAATYDPQNIASNAFARSNHTGTQLLSTIMDAGALASFDTVATAQIQDDAVTLAKQAHGTPNRLMGYNASGVPVEITAGSGISITGAEITATGGGTGTGGAPLGVSYLVLSNDVDLTNERALTVSGGLQATDGGPNGTYTISGGPLQTLQRAPNISAGGTYQITASDLGKILPFTVATTVTVATGISNAAGDFYCVIEKAVGASGDVTFNPAGITHQPQGGSLPSYVITTPGGQATIYQKGGGDVYGTVGAWALPIKSPPVSADHVFGEDSENSGRPVLIPVGDLGGAGGSNPALADVTDVTITAVADNEVLAYDQTSGGWINQTASEAGLVTVDSMSGLVQVTDAQLSGPYTVPNNRRFLVIQASDNFLANRTTVLPASPAFPGQQILLQRWGGAFFEWRIQGFGSGGDAVLFRGDAVIAVANDTATAWSRKIGIPADIEKTLSEGLGGTVAIDQAKYAREAGGATTATTYQINGSMGSGFFARFIQDNGQVTVTAANGATLYAGAPNQTLSRGDELQVSVTNNPDGNSANVQVKLVLANPSMDVGEGGSIQRRTPFASGGSYQITASDFGEVLPFTDATTFAIAPGIAVSNGDFWCVVEKAGAGNITLDPTGITHEPRGAALPSYVIMSERGQVMIVQKGSGSNTYSTAGDWANLPTNVGAKTYTNSDHGRDYRVTTGTQTFSAAANYRADFHVNLFREVSGNITIDGVDADHTLPGPGVVTIKKVGTALMAFGNGSPPVTILDVA